MSISHSLFGLVWQIATETGWSVRYITEKVPYQLLMAMMADAPKWIEGVDGKNKVPGMNPHGKRKDIVKQFQNYFNKK